MAFAEYVSQSLLVPPSFALHVVMNSPLHHLVFQRLVHCREFNTLSQCHAFSVPGIGVSSVPDILPSEPKTFFSSYGTEWKCGTGLQSAGPGTSTLQCFVSLWYCQHDFFHIFSSFSDFNTCSGVKFQNSSSHWPGHFPILFHTLCSS